jgi:hypothetical protein
MAFRIASRVATESRPCVQPVQSRASRKAEEAGFFSPRLTVLSLTGSRSRLITFRDLKLFLLVMTNGRPRDWQIQDHSPERPPAGRRFVWAAC